MPARRRRLCRSTLLMLMLVIHLPLQPGGSRADGIHTYIHTVYTDTHTQARARTHTRTRAHTHTHTHTHTHVYYMASTTKLERARASTGKGRLVLGSRELPYCARGGSCWGLRPGWPQAPGPARPETAGTLSTVTATPRPPGPVRATRRSESVDSRHKHPTGRHWQRPGRAPFAAGKLAPALRGHAGPARQATSPPAGEV